MQHVDLLCAGHETVFAFVWEASFVTIWSVHLVMHRYLRYLCLQRTLQQEKRVVPFHKSLRSTQQTTHKQLRTESQPAATHASTEKGKSKVANSSLCVKTS